MDTFSQPLGSVVQISYIVDDLEAAAKRWIDTMGAGPFFLLEHVEIADPKYRGKPTELDISLAIGYSGGVGIELVKQHNDAPSVYKEVAAESGGAFHHFAVMTEDFDAEVKRYTGAGYEMAFEGAVAVGGRFAYVDTKDHLGGLVELIELTPVVRDLFMMLESAAVGWDGSEPVRRL